MSSKNESGIRENAYTMLYEVLENGGFSNLVIRSGESDAFTTALFYGTIARCHTIDFLLKHFAKTDIAECDPETRTLLRMGAWQIFFSEKVPSFAAVSTTVELCKKVHKSSTSYVNAILRKLSEADYDESSFKPEVQTSLKSEIFGILKKSYGRDRALDIGKALLERPDITVRTNILKTTRDELKESLIKSGVTVRDAHFMKDALIIDGTNIETLSEFKDGLFFVQNEAAQLASIVADPDKDISILDCCAAPGGKSTHLAELTSDSAKITSLDINESRLELIRENAVRLGLENISVSSGDSTKAFEGTYDMVMCDVPCSGLGLMGRKPDIRLTISYDRIAELLPKQKQILQNAADAVRPGGKLIYCTCTLNRAENEERIEQFLIDNPDFSPVDITDIVPEILNDDLRREGLKRGMITLYPDIDGCDGFFVCRLERSTDGKKVLS